MMDKEIKIGTEVWFTSDYELLRGVINEVYEYTVVVASGGSIYVLPKEYLTFSRKECLEICDKRCGEIVKLRS